MKKRRKKLTLHRETLRSLNSDSLQAALGQADVPLTFTCPESGCYVCSANGCTFGCPRTPE